MSSNSYLDTIKNWDSYIKDTQYTEEENLIFQLNHDNDTEFRLSDVTIGVPSVISADHIDITNPNTPIQNNTRVTITAKPNTNLRGSDDYCYRRLDIGIQWNILYRSKPFNVDLNLTDEKILQELHKKMPFRVGSLKVIRTSSSADIVPIDNSLLYIGKISITSNRHGPIEKINKGKEQNRTMKGLDYHTRPTLQLQAFDYHQK